MAFVTSGRQTNGQNIYRTDAFIKKEYIVHNKNQRKENEPFLRPKCFFDLVMLELSSRFQTQYDGS